VRWGIEGAKGGLFKSAGGDGAQQAYYQRLLLRGRILVPASHFYEWRKVGERRLPMAVSRADGGFLHLAGLLARWEGQPAATILTTTPNADIATLHNRMPVILNDDDAATWVLEDLSLAQLADSNLNAYFPSIAMIDRPRFPAVHTLTSELRRAGFEDVRSKCARNRAGSTSRRWSTACAADISRP